jgi:hypothetical protein
MALETVASDSPSLSASWLVAGVTRVVNESNNVAISESSRREAGV